MHLNQTGMKEVLRGMWADDDPVTPLPVSARMWSFKKNLKVLFFYVLMSQVSVRELTGELHFMHILMSGFVILSFDNNIFDHLNGSLMLPVYSFLILSC